MKLKAIFLSLIALISMSIVPATANPNVTLTVADDSSSGTFKKMFGDIVSVCSADINLTEVNKGGGAVGNLNALVTNDAQAAFTDSDVYFTQAQADPTYRRFQTLVALYPDPIHILALKSSKSKANLISTKQFNSLADMRGFAIGAAGGGVFTARILEGQGEGGFTVNPYNSGDEVIAALNKGEIAGAIFVGAAPLPNLQKLDKTQYKILPIGDSIANKVQGVYRPAAINYPGMTDGPIKTIAPLAVILSRKYNTEDHIAAQRTFRNCFNRNLPRLKDDASPNWQQVNAGDHGVLDWLEIPNK